MKVTLHLRNICSQHLDKLWTAKIKNVRTEKDTLNIQPRKKRVQKEFRNMLFHNLQTEESYVEVEQVIPGTAERSKKWEGGGGGGGWGVGMNRGGRCV